jgi:hypothetical protein
VTDPGSFVAMRLTGQRFEEAGMPVDALPELAAYRDLVLAVARELFLRRNPSRQRVPRGFADSFQLRLRQIDKGSAIPVLERVSDTTALFPSDTDTLFDQSRDLIQGAILAVASSGRLPEEFPISTLADFSRFGRTLRAGEFIELSSPAAPRPARYSGAVRRILIKSKRSNYLQESAIDGVITEINSDRVSFQLAHLSRAGLATSIPCTFDPELFESIRRRLRAPGEDGTPVRVEGFISFSPSDRPVAVPHVLGITAAGEEDADENIGVVADVVSVSAAHIEAARRLDAMSELTDGWLDGEGSAVSGRVVGFVRDVLSDVSEDTIKDIRIFPTEPGGLRLEWQRYSTEFSLDFNADGSISYDDVDLETGSATERTLSFDDLDDVRVLLTGV